MLHRITKGATWKKSPISRIKQLRGKTFDPYFTFSGANI
jgi:hypothetical protein